MKGKLSLFGAILVLCSMVTGCAGNSMNNSRLAVSSRQDVFQEQGSVNVAAGKAILRIEFSVKEYDRKIFNTYLKHADPPFTTVVNIDGQAIELADEPVLEDLPGHDEDNPEAGTGWRYKFRRTLVLAPGKHRVTVLVPVEQVAVETELDLKEGENILKLQPRYITSLSGSPRVPRFSNGLKGIDVMLNEHAR